MVSNETTDDDDNCSGDEDVISPRFYFRYIQGSSDCQDNQTDDQ